VSPFEHDVRWKGKLKRKYVRIAHPSATAHFLAYRHPFPIGQPVPLDSYITNYIFALMMEAACTSETSVGIDLITWQYIP
jgi:hypothetical protein